MGPDEGDDKHVVILGRHVRWTADGIEYEADPEADPKHRKLIMEHFGFDEESSGLVFVTVRRIGRRRRNGRKYYWRKMRRRFFVESRRGRTF